MIAACLSTHAGDVQAAKALMRWIVKLGGCSEFDLAIIADAGTEAPQVIELKNIAEKAFKSVVVTSTEKAVRGWPTGSNSNWSRAAQWAKENGRAFLFIEPDSIPLAAYWLKQIDAEYARGQWKYIGHIYNCTQPYMPQRIMSGIAVYPPTAIDEMAPLPLTPRAWDIDGAEVMVGNGSHTPLIRHFWGTQQLPPVFVEAKTASSPINALALDWLPPECVLFHRDKTHSLIKLLTRKFFPQESSTTKIVAVFPVCGKDIAQAIHHAKWLKSMNRKWDHKAMIAYDYSVHVLHLTELKRWLDGCFESVEAFVYPLPPIPTYPQCANWCWQSVAHRMSQQGCPWLFLEADAVVLRADWIDQLQSEYDRCARPFMGPVVPHMGHMNGTMIYPANAAGRMPRAMACGSGEAFDMVAKEDIGEDRHDCSHLFFHTWSIVGDQFHPVGGGQIPASITPAMAARIPRTAVAIHRIKDTSLIDLLMAGHYRHG